jgi:hypothetical protein
MSAPEPPGWDNLGGSGLLIPAAHNLGIAAGAGKSSFQPTPGQDCYN